MPSTVAFSDISYTKQFVGGLKTWNISVAGEDIKVSGLTPFSFDEDATPTIQRFSQTKPRKFVEGRTDSWQ